MKIPFVDLKAQYLTIKDEIDSAISNVINETAFIGGKYVNEFEDKFSKLYGVNNVISCANGTDSLYIILKMLGIGAGDEVITVSNSWISSSETISQTGARVKFVDIDSKYYTIDENSIEESISNKTKAIVIVHLYGQMCDVEKVNQICQKHNIFLVEDCAQSHFSSLNNVKAGLTGIAGSFSFYPGKNLGAYGDAGCIITNNDEFALKCRMYSKHGALKKHEHLIEGINSRLDGIQASILLAKLPHILDWTQKRRDIACMYSEKLKDYKQVTLPEVRPNSVHSFHLYVIRVSENERDLLMNHLKENNIDTFIHYPTPLPFMEAYKYLNYTEADFPNLCKVKNEIISLPIYPEMTEEMVSYVVDKIGSFYNA